MDLFQEKRGESADIRPLADRIRPRSLKEFIGQQHLLGKEKILRKAIETDQLFSMLFWGPPGVGKTTLAHIIAKETKSEFHALSAVTSGVADIRKLIARAKTNLIELERRTINR